MRRGAPLVAALAGLLAAACGSPAAQSPRAPTPTPVETPLPSAAPTDAPAQSVIAVSVDNGTLLELLSESGAVLGSDPQAHPSSFAAVSTTAGAFWYVASDTHHLHRVTPDGHDTDVAALPGVTGAQLSGLAVSPDGTRWAFGVSTATSAAGTTSVVVAGPATSQTVLDEPTRNTVLAPLAWTTHGLFVARDLTGIGGCCYLAPEYGARDMLELDPTTFATTATWSGCATHAVDPGGSFACVQTDAKGDVVAHLASGSSATCAPVAPALRTGWGIVDDVHDRAVFGVIHSYGAGGGDGPYVIDTEACDLATSAVTTLFTQMTPDAALADGSLVITSAPAAPAGGMPTHVSLSAGGVTTQLGPPGSAYVASFPVSG